MAKKILANMMKFVEKEKGKEYVRLSLSSLRINNQPVSIKKVNILLDGGASHNVYFGPKIPKGALRREVELASGTKVGYVKGSDITFIDEAISEEQAETPTIVSLGRLIQQGVKMEWTKDGASLELPNKKKVAIPVRNNCPHANEEVLRIVEKFRDLEDTRRELRVYYTSI